MINDKIYKFLENKNIETCFIMTVDENGKTSFLHDCKNVTDGLSLVNEYEKSVYDYLRKKV